MADVEMEVVGEIDGFIVALLNRGPTMTMDYVNSEMQWREQALEDAVLRAVQAGMPPDEVAEMQRLVLAPYRETFRRGLIGEPPEKVEPMRLVWTPTACSMATPKLYTQEKYAWLSEQVKILERAHMVYFDPLVTFAIEATVLQKGGRTPGGCELVGGELSRRTSFVAAHALGRGARFLRWDDLLGDD